MEDLHCLRLVRSNPALTSLLVAQRQMSASTPPELNNEIRLPLSDECYIPLPPSPSLSAQDASEGEQDIGTQDNEEQSLPLPLLELLHAIQEDNYESRRLVVLQDEAFGLFHKCGSCDRFLTVQAQLYRCMMDCFKNDKKTAFSSLYTKAMSYPAFGELYIKGPIMDDDLEDSTEISWVERLPPDSRLALMDFLFRLRSDPGFVADRISRLSAIQLKKLNRLHGPLEPGQIFRGNQSQGRYTQRGMGKPNETEISVDDLLSDPLLLMVHGVFDRNSSERSYQIDIWSSVCAKLVEDGKPGSDEFCITVLNLFVDIPNWSATPKLELFLSDLVVAGASFLEAGGHSIKFTHPQHRDTNSGTFSFLDSYIPRLLEILHDNPAPAQALDLIRSILTKISDPHRKLAARNFFFLRWYCACFLTNAIIYPENHGILLEHHINTSIRQKVLRELTLRLQSLVSGFLSHWPSKPALSPLEGKVRSILVLFEQENPSVIYASNQESTRRCFLFLRSEDVLAMARALMVTEAPNSSSSSFSETAQSKPPSTLPYRNQFDAGINPLYTLPNLNGNAVIGNQTWHGNIPVMDSGYNTMDRTMRRPSTLGDTMTDPEKYSSMSFIHDLWTLNVSGGFRSAGSGKHEVAVIFVRGDGRTLSIDPFQRHGDSLPTDRLMYGLDAEIQKALTAAVLQLAERTSDLENNYSTTSLTSLSGLIDLFEDQAKEANNLYDFQSECFWWQCISILKNTGSHILTAFLTSFAKQRQAKVARQREMAKQYEVWLHALRKRSNIQDQQNQKLSLSSKRLRNKMWFVSDVRHSSAYEDAYSVARALRAMLEPTEQKQAGVTGWAKQRFRSSYGQERAMTQLLELMTAPKIYGGPNKLSENQVEVTAGWLLHDNIENFCRGEERIHRFCYEIQKCVKRLAGEALLDSPVLWSSLLYANEKSEYAIAAQSGSRQQQDRFARRSTDFTYQQWSTGQTLPGPLPYPGAERLVSATSPTRTMFDHPSLQASFPQLLPLSQTSGVSQGSGNWMLPPSPISPGNVKISYDGASLRRRSFLQNLRTHLTSLLLSDLGSLLWKHGSDTDLWISALDHSRRQSPVIPQEPLDARGSINNSFSNDEANTTSTSTSFDFSEAYRVILQRFALTSNPQNKLRYLHELFVLVGHAQRYRNQDQQSPIPFDLNNPESHLGNLGIGSGAPRTRLTRLQEVAANCEDRRISSISNSRSGPVFDLYARILPSPHVDDSELIEAVQNIFEDPTYRPPAFFRDLQYIAAFTPSSILDHTPQGTAFWTIGLAAMRIKSQKCKIMTDNAMQILDFHYGNGNRREPVREGQSSPSNQSVSTGHLSRQDLLGTTLRDAARLLTISALEGDPTAARELGLFHLTHPELVSRVTLPLSRPSDVFRAKHGLASERGNRNGNEESGVLDSVTFAVVFHWMEFAASAGDADAITFFKENKDLGKAL